MPTIHRLILLMLCLPHCTWCQVHPAGFLQLHTGTGAYSRNAVTPLSGLENMAALHAIKHFSAEINLEKHIHLSALDRISGMFTLPFSNGTLAILAGSFGRTIYKESAIGAGWAHNLGKTAVAGSIKYHRILIAGNRASGYLSADAGAIFFPTEYLSTGIYISNANQGRVSGEKTPMQISAGLGYSVSTQVNLSAMLVKMEDVPAMVKTSLIYRPGNAFSSSISYVSGSGVLAVAAGWTFSGISIHVGVIYYPAFGVVPALNVLYRNGL